MSVLTAVPAQLPRAPRQAVLGVFVLFIAAGIVQRALDDPVQAAVGAAIAVAFGAAAIEGPSRFVIPAAGLATAGVAVLGNGTPSNVCWFALPVLAAWCAMSASLLVLGLYWVAAMGLLGYEAIFVRHDPGR